MCGLDVSNGKLFIVANPMTLPNLQVYILHNVFGQFGKGVIHHHHHTLKSINLRDLFFYVGT